MTASGGAKVLLETVTAQHQASVQVAEEDSDSWRITALDSRLEGVANQASMAVGASNLVAVSWHQEGSGVHLATKWGGGPWELPSEVDARISAVADAYRPNVAVADSGEILTVFGQKTSSGVGMALSMRPPRSAAVQRPQGADDVLSPLVFFTNEGDVAVNARGEALVTWYQSTGAQLEVYASERPSRFGAFSRPRPGQQLSPPSPEREGAGGRYLGFTSSALSDTGEAVAVWTQPAASGAFPVYMARRPPSRDWQRVASIDDTFSRPDVDACCTRAVFAPDGALVVLWQERREGQTRVVVAARRSDGSWPHPGHEPLALSGWREEIGEFDVALGQRGTGVVAWSERDASRWRIVVRRTGPAPDGWRGAQVMAESTETIVRIPHVAVGGPEERTILAWRMDNELWYRFLE